MKARLRRGLVVGALYGASALAIELWIVRGGPTRRDVAELRAKIRAAGR